MEPTSESSKTASRPINPWMIATGVLVIVLLAVLAFDNPLAPKVERANPETSAQALVSFINTIYAGQVGPATLVSTTEEHGLYKVTVKASNQEGAPITQDVYMSLDGKMFVPEAHEMSEVLMRFEEYQESLKNGTANTNQDAAGGTMEAGSTTTVSGEDAAAL
jgi:hypothetical protein